MQTIDPPSGAVFELAERAVDYVRRALQVTLDYTPDTLPVLDHYLLQVPQDQPDTVTLVAATAGAYFGEVARRTLGGKWRDRDDESPISWVLELSGGVVFRPAGMAGQAVLVGEAEEFDGELDVPDKVRPAVEAALDAHGEIPEDEYYSLCGRMETLMLVVDTAVGAAAPKDAPPGGEGDE